MHFKNGSFKKANCTMFWMLKIVAVKFKINSKTSKIFNTLSNGEIQVKVSYKNLKSYTSEKTKYMYFPSQAKWIQTANKK